MNKLLTAILFLTILSASAQSDEEYWAKWNNNYPSVNIKEILAYEEFYADSVAKNPGIAPAYSRMDKYRFNAIYEGKTRSLDNSVQASMKNVLKIHAGNASALDKLVVSEVLFKIDSIEIWMPVQSQILKALKDEAKQGDQLTLYCLLLNDHTADYTLFNSLVISEFSME